MLEATDQRGAGPVGKAAPDQAIVCCLVADHLNEIGRTVTDERSRTEMLVTLDDVERLVLVRGANGARELPGKGEAEWADRAQGPTTEGTAPAWPEHPHAGNHSVNN